MSKKVLIIGGTCKTAFNVAKELNKNNYAIELMTYRHQNNIPDENSISKEWDYLDLFDEYSVNIFLKNQKNKKYDKIIFFISNSVNHNKKSLNYKKEDLEKFYGVFCTNYIILINDLTNNLSDCGSMIYISSSASDTGASDPVYASGKALIQSHVLSLNYFLKNDQSACFISPGAIAGSNFYESLEENHPIKLDLDAITYPENITEVIMHSEIYKGKRVKLGWNKDWEK